MKKTNEILNSPKFTIGIVVTIILVIVLYNIETTRNLMLSTFDDVSFEVTSSDTLHLFTFAEYFHEDVIQDFSRKHNIYVKATLFDTQQQMLDSLLAGKRYDLITPSDYTVEELVKLGLIKLIDKDKIPRYLHIDVRLREMDYDFGNNYSIPYFWGAVGLMYNNNYVINPPLSWESIFDTTLINQVRHKVALLDDARATLGIALIANGHSPNTTDPQQISDAADSLIRIATFLGGVQSDGLESEFDSGNLYMSMNWSGSAALANSTHSYLRFSMPAEGSIFFVDNLSIPTNAKNEDAAYKFIDYLLLSETAALMTNTNYYPNPITHSRRYIDRSILKGPAYFNPFLSADANIHFVQDLGIVDTLYAHHWNRFKDFYNYHDTTTSENQRGTSRIILH
jgi:spermidine/putrescine transport system substrate-binding protein